MEATLGQLKAAAEQRQVLADQLDRTREFIRDRVTDLEQTADRAVEDAVAALANSNLRATQLFLQDAATARHSARELSRVLELLR